MSTCRIGVLGASSLVGDHLIRLLALLGDDDVIAFSRKRRSGDAIYRARWLALDHLRDEAMSFDGWICLAPIWVLPDYFEALERAGVRRVVALSSTSRFSKISSSSAEDRRLAARLADAEQRIQDWAETRGVQWVILRSTLIYGDGRDRNVSDIARFLRRWCCFPLIGGSAGLRQPVHAADVAEFCIRALKHPVATGHAFDICGGETLTYRDMVKRIGDAMGISVRFLAVPRPILRGAVRAIACLPRFRSLSPALIDRLAQDLVFDGSAANRLFNVAPRPFVVTPTDLPTV